MRNCFAHWRWIILLLLYSADAHAWGLYTHVYFAQHLIWAIPLTDPRYYHAVRRFPRLVLAGACLPDLSLVCEHFGLHDLTDSHQWQNTHDLVRNAASDEERAIAIGYTSHLWVDVIAHNHFVPAHERMWVNIPLATHAVAEWAMDHHISRQLYRRPTELLREHEQQLSQYVSRNFGGSINASRKALGWLTSGEAAVRHSGFPGLCFHAAQEIDQGLQRRFNYYLSETSSRLRHINRILAGETPGWFAEPPCPKTTRQRIDGVPMLKLRHRIPIPQDFFASIDATGNH